MDQQVKKIVVVGGGFAGINFVKSLSGDKRFLVTLVDINNYHFFTPLIYQVAASFIEPSNISYPFRRMFQERENLRFHMGALEKVEVANNMIVTSTGNLIYDYLVLAVGTESNYFGMENVRNNSLPMKSISDALKLRNHLLLSMECAVRITGNEEKSKYLNIVIAGGGPSGVEIAGMLAEMGQYIAAREYPEITDLRSHIYLIDSGPVLLAPMSKKAQAEALEVLKGLGVHVLLNVAVKDYVDQTVHLANGEKIFSNTLIWTSGVTGREVPGIPAESVVRGKRIAVNAFNKVNGTTNIFAIGDIAYQETDKNYPKGHPQVAQVAMQHGKILARNLVNLYANKSLVPFAYRDKGSMAIISKYKAVADLPALSFKGFFAWLIWLFIHLIPLAGFRNKIKLMLNWFWAFISNNPTLRLIIKANK